MIRRPESPSDVAECFSVALCDDLIAACPAALTGMSGEEFERFSEIIAAALDAAFAAGADSQRGDPLDDRPDIEPLRPVADVLHAELLRSDVVEYIAEVPGHSPEMLRIGRMVLSGMSAGPLFEALRGFCLDFTDDKE